jgi:predicted lipid-binding transport protein (Tim44 family)
VSPDPRGPLRLAGPRSLVGRVVGALVTVAVLVVGLMFSAVLFGVALVLGLLVWGWVWWKMRKVLRQMRQDPRFQQFQQAAARDAAPDDTGRMEGRSRPARLTSCLQSARCAACRSFRSRPRTPFSERSSTCSKCSAPP